MKISLKSLTGIVLLTVLALALSFPLFAFADKDLNSVVTDAANTASETSTTSEDEAQGAGVATGAASTEAPATDQMTQEDVTKISEAEIPLSVRPYEIGWSLVSLIASLLTIIIGVTLMVFSVVRRNDRAHSSSTFGLSIFGMAAAILSTILFTSTEEIQAKMVLVDSFTVAHLAVLTVAVLCAILTMKRGVETSHSDDSSQE
jgi:hypothetical protein